MKTLNGKPIEDAKRPFTFTVATRDYIYGAQNDPTSCVLANGCKRGGAVISSRFGVTIALLEFPKRVLRFKVPRAYQNKIRQFDQNARVFPAGPYTLIPPEPTRTNPVKGKGRKQVRSDPLRHCMRVK